jgi:acetyl-CoA acetyltransferase
MTGARYGGLVETVTIVGAGMTRFEKSPRSLRALAGEAVTAALEDAGLEAAELEAAYVGNGVAGLVTGQEMIRGQVMLRPLGIEGIPVFNVENACASSSSALHLGWQAVASGMQDVVLCLGAEKLSHEDKAVGMAAIGTAVDIEAQTEMAEALGSGEDSAKRSFFMDIYAGMARSYMELSGATKEDFAQVVVKNQRNGARNPRAQYGSELSVEDVLASRTIVDPLTLLMCSPDLRRRGRGRADVRGGGAASGCARAAHPRVRGRLGQPARQVRSQRRLRRPRGGGGLRPGGPRARRTWTARRCTTPARRPSSSSTSSSGSRRPAGARTSSPPAGPARRGPAGEHERRAAEQGPPDRATGLAQVCEATWQLRGQAGARQVDGARVALAQNGGGWLDEDSAAMSVHILTAD